MTLTTFSYVTNTAYILNTYFQNFIKERQVDGEAFEFIQNQHDKEWAERHSKFIKITFEVVDE